MRRTPIFGCVACAWLILMIRCTAGYAPVLPVVINTWPFVNATAKAWHVIWVQNGSALDAIEQGCTVCEQEQCDGTVGFGGSPDENGETTLDAMIMDGVTHDVGAVGALRQVKQAISVARRVMEYTEETFLAGDQATAFAVRMGFETTNLSTPESIKEWEAWKANDCQPNYWQPDVVPDPTKSCGPYSPGAVPRRRMARNRRHLRPPIHEGNHDTIGMVAIDRDGNIASGTSTNGASHKVPGRVGDGPMVGAGSYADRDVGACAATGDGDVMMRCWTCDQAVESMRLGMSPQDATADAIRRIEKFYPTFIGAIVAVNKAGEYAGACHGWTFTFSVVNPQLQNVTVVTVPPI
eukprot:TRINITY_DN6147_c0_g1_i1.p1 TRINITY_DN6147_c0_g1~~TRINITY_DN6147_c0_g1_i1.p1  ORF type:complete len:369 (-),score=44.17 TRINITY_DN6147_c0_g1_i1:120-1172(-)